LRGRGWRHDFRGWRRLHSFKGRGRLHGFRGRGWPHVSDGGCLFHERKEGLRLRGLGGGLARQRVVQVEAVVLKQRQLGLRGRRHDFRGRRRLDDFRDRGRLYDLRGRGWRYDLRGRRRRYDLRGGGRRRDFRLQKFRDRRLLDGCRLFEQSKETLGFCRGGRRLARQRVVKVGGIILQQPQLTKIGVGFPGSRHHGPLLTWANGPAAFEHPSGHHCHTHPH